MARYEVIDAVNNQTDGSPTTKTSGDRIYLDPERHVAKQNRSTRLAAISVKSRNKRRKKSDQNHKH